MATLKIPQEESHITYMQGYDARKYNRPKSIPFPVIDDKSFCLKYWWLAGYNDYELDVKGSKQ